jgi:hypothetical protein
MKCGLVDIGCHLHAFIDPFWFWIQLGFWVVVALVALGILYRIKQVFGWQGVLAALVAAGGVIIAIFSFKAGRDSITTEGDFDPPVRPKPPRPPLPIEPERKQPKPKPRPKPGPKPKPKR